MKYHTSSSLYRWLVFFVGVIATIAYRVIVVLNDYSPLLVEVTWYVGTIGFVWYFAHRFRVQNYRTRLINEKNLAKKIRQNKLSKDDQDALVFILKSTSSSKEKWNSIAIFILSAAALFYAIASDIMQITK